jgi:prolipoprotein diacylglyceryltransferase
MQQVLFHIPFTAGLVTPEGVPVYGFGAMLFLTFVVVAMLWGPLRVAKVGMPKDRLQDMAIVLFLTGIAGARIVYMIQYSDQFPDKSPWGLIKSFFQIWNGGIVFYGSVFGGIIGYLLFRRYVLRRFNVSDWKLADAVAPLIALGLAIGRIGCYLNGCCWGQPVCEQCQPVPLSPELGKFPLVPAHARDQVVVPALEPDEKRPEIRGLQTSTGFTILPQVERPGTGDPRSVVANLEPASAAEKTGLKAGDRIIQVNGRPNLAILDLIGPADVLGQAAERLRAAGGVELGTGRFGFADLTAYHAAAAKLTDLRPRGLSLSAHDTLTELVRDWPRGVNTLSLVVERPGEQVSLAFVPRTVPFFPTQLYETVSMVLLTFLLVAFQPFRRHNGQVMVLLMLGYAVHRFLNEAIRIEPTYALGLTLSQWISVGIFAAGILLELYLRATQPKLPPGPVPLSYGVTPVLPAEKVPTVAPA